MEFRQLGNSELKVSPIGLGCWQFSQGKSITASYWPKLSDHTTNLIVKASLDGGINWFDTAEAYGWGKSESGLAQALKVAQKKPGEVVIATKWFPIGRTAQSITKSIPKRITALADYPIDLFQIHAPYGALSSHKKQLDAMAELVKEGKIKNIGVSNFSANQMRRAFEYLKSIGANLASNQIHFNLMNRKPESNGIIQTAQELGISIIAYSPLAQGLLTGKFHEDPNLIKSRVGPRKKMKRFSPKGMEESKSLITELTRIAKSHQATPAQIALCWLTQAHKETVLAIPGATKIEQAVQNAKALKIALTEEEIGWLDIVSRSFK